MVNELYWYSIKKRVIYKLILMLYKYEQDMSMPRKVQRSIWRLNMRCPTYSQVTTGQPLRCRWCDEDYNSITEHWLRHCPTMIYWQELMTARLTEHEAFLDDIETTIAILNSQNTVAYEEITGSYEAFLFQGQVRKHN